MEYIIKCSPSVLEKLPPTIIRMIEKEVKEALWFREIRAKKKLLENIEVGGTRYGVSCHIVGNILMITQITPRKKKKASKSMKKEKRYR